MTNVEFLDEPGYINGSIYLREVHNPVDVTELAFKSWRGDRIGAGLRMRLIFEFEESGLRDRDALLTAMLRRP